MTTFIFTELNDFLEDRFDDIDEIRDVANYGCAAGVTGFIYSCELAETFDYYEEQIEDLLDSHGIKYTDLVPDFETLQQVKEAAVWYAVQTWCHQALEAYQEQEQENQWKEEQEEQQGLANELLAAALS